MAKTINNEITAMDFETAFRSLEENVAILESEELPLEKALEVYERGQLLARHCADLLEAAELKVRQLSEDPKSKPEG
ncbi:MAG: exodeoxyribonuclease VII small subunit [Anaerolineaceae bacterium]|jgi:exodeoxyribonuclease VII small subunit|nr:exodeoxyribonuclease VII small subunit [Anaerolineaceae bacterium]